MPLASSLLYAGLYRSLECINSFWPFSFSFCFLLLITINFIARREKIPKKKKKNTQPPNRNNKEENYNTKIHLKRKARMAHLTYQKQASREISRACRKWLKNSLSRLTHSETVQKTESTASLAAPLSPLKIRQFLSNQIFYKSANKQSFHNIFYRCVPPPILHC